MTHVTHQTVDVPMRFGRPDNTYLTRRRLLPDVPDGPVGPVGYAEGSLRIQGTGRQLTLGSLFKKGHRSGRTLTDADASPFVCLSSRSCRNFSRAVDNASHVCGTLSGEEN